MKVKVLIAGIAALVPAATMATTPPYNYYDVMREIREGIQKAQNQLANCTASATVCQNRYNRALSAVQDYISDVASNDALRNSTQGIVANRLNEIYSNQLACGETEAAKRVCQKSDRQTVERLLKRVLEENPKPVSP